jgi:O-antigen/teichoic acid export membrane protein
MGVFLVFLAEPIAAFFGAREATWAFRVMAIIPFLKGLEHLDNRRLQRDMRFAQFAWRTAIPQVLTMLLAYPVARWTGDYSAWLYLLLLQALASSVASHVMAERAFKLGMTAPHARRMVSFGLPLVMNGVVLFMVMQGDRAIVGRLYTKIELGIYSNTFTLALMAGNLTMSVISTLMLPVLAQAKNDPLRFERMCGRLAEMSSVISATLGAGMVLAGPGLIRLVYVKEYWPGATLVGVMGFAAAYRTLRMMPNAAQMAKGDTPSVLYANFVRVLGVGFALAAALHGASLLVLSGCALLGEVLAVLGSAWLLKARQQVRLGTVLVPMLVCSIAFAVAGAISILPVWPRGPLLSLILGSGLALVVGAATAWVQPGLRKEIVEGLPKARAWLQAKLARRTA